MNDADQNAAGKIETLVECVEIRLDDAERALMGRAVSLSGSPINGRLSEAIATQVSARKALEELDATGCTALPRAACLLHMLAQYTVATDFREPECLDLWSKLTALEPLKRAREVEDLRDRARAKAASLRARAEALERRL